jgi:hypothetical protein
MLYDNTTVFLCSYSCEKELSEDTNKVP